MATIRKRNGKWQAQVRRAGHAPRTQSFGSSSDARRWARDVERDLDRSLIPFDTQRLAEITVADLPNRYRETVTIKKGGLASERKRSEVLLRSSWAALPLSKTTPQVFSRYRDLRLTEMRPGTVIRELGILRSVFETARREWDIPMHANPVSLVRKPRAADGRDRRLRDQELEVLLNHCGRGRSDWLGSGILLAIETGMRRGELLSVQWRDLDLPSAILSIPVTKTGYARRTPLTERAVELFRAQLPEVPIPGDRVFPVPGAQTFRFEKKVRNISGRRALSASALLP